MGNDVKARISEIEHAIACGEMSAAQVFTQMRQLIPLQQAEPVCSAACAQLRAAITPQILDYVRCGIGSNYGGERFAERLEEVRSPLMSAIAGFDSAPTQPAKVQPAEPVVMSFAVVGNGYVQRDAATSQLEIYDLKSAAQANCPPGYTVKPVAIRRGDASPEPAAPKCWMCERERTDIELRQVHDGGGITDPEYTCEECFPPQDTGPTFDDFPKVEA